MAASLGFRNSDGTSGITSLDLGAIPPGKRYSEVAGESKLLYAANTGDVTFTQTTIQVQQAGADAAFNWAGISLSSTGGGGGELQLGPLNPQVAAPFYLDVTVPAEEAGGAHQFNLYLVGII